MRRIPLILTVLVFAGAIASVLGAAGITHAHRTQVPASTTRAIPCSGSRVQGSVGRDPVWETEFLTKTGDCVQQDAAKCTNRLGTVTIWTHGGWVNPVGKYSGSNCTAQEDSFVQGNINVSDNGGRTYGYQCLIHCPGRARG